MTLGDWTNEQDRDEDDFFWDDARQDFINAVSTRCCKYCGLHGLRWGQDDRGRWRLFDKGRQHKCGRDA